MVVAMAGLDLVRDDDNDSIRVDNLVWHALASVLGVE